MSDYEYRPFSWEALKVIQVDNEGAGAVVHWNIPTIEEPTYHLPEGEMVTVTIRVPEQFFEFSVPRSAWESCESDNQRCHLADQAIDFAGLDIEDELYGPDGQQVGDW